MLIEEIWDEIRLIFKKERRGSLRDSQIETAVKLACKELYGTYLEEFRTGRILPSSLDPFRESASIDFASSSTKDVSSQSPAIEEVIAASQSSNPKRIEIIYNDDEWNDAVNSVLLDSEDTFIRKIGDNLESNKTLTTVTVDYLKRPTTWFAVTVNIDGDSRGTTVTGTTDVPFKEPDAPRLLAKALTYLGLPLQSPDVVQVGAGKDR